MNHPPIYFSRIRPVTKPSRGTQRSAGIDFFVPDFTPEFIKDLKNKNSDVTILYEEIDKIRHFPLIVLAPGERINIPSGVRVRCPVDHALFAKNKSGVGTKKGLDKLAELGDEDYQGELHISVTNSGTKLQFIKPNEKLIQFVAAPVHLGEPTEIDDKQLFAEITERGIGGFGSTDEKKT